MTTEFAGIWPALVTPFTPDDVVNTDMIGQLIECRLCDRSMTDVETD